jgi:hypothetical protein
MPVTPGASTEDISTPVTEPTGPKGSQTSSPQRLSVNLSPEAAAALRWLKARYGGSTTEAIRRAISTEKYIQEQVDSGAKILVAREGQPLREIVFR